MIEVTAEALAAHPFLHGMSRDHLAVLAETGVPRRVFHLAASAIALKVSAP